jgi:hypothetical protein
MREGIGSLARILKTIEVRSRLTASAWVATPLTDRFDGWLARQLLLAVTFYVTVTVSLTGIVT